jgi:hypothetical protein
LSEYILAPNILETSKKKNKDVVEDKKYATGCFPYSKKKRTTKKIHRKKIYLT